MWGCLWESLRQGEAGVLDPCCGGLELGSCCFWCQNSWILTLGLWCLIEDFLSLVEGFWFPLLHFWCLIGGFWFRIENFLYLVLGSLLQTENLWSLA